MNRYFNRSIDKALKRGRDGYYIKTEFGILGIWNDEDGLYIDLIGNQGNTVCLVGLSEELDGLLASIYGNQASGFPTYEYLFNKEDLSHAFDEDNVRDFINDSYDEGNNGA